MKRSTKVIAITCTAMLSAVFIVLFIVMSPLVLFMGEQRQTIASWNAPLGIWGIPQQIRVDAERVSYSVDPFNFLQETRLLITAGGYGYLVDRALSVRDIETVKFVWHPDGVQIVFESGNTVAIPRDRIIAQIGRANQQCALSGTEDSRLVSANVGNDSCTRSDR